MGAGSSAAGPSRIIKLPDGLDDVSDSEIGSGSSTSIDSENPTEDEKAKNKFTVEYFTEARPDGEGGWLYNVKWYRYKDNEKNNTWEPSYSLKACRLLMRSFWEHVGRERSDSSIYHEDNPIIPTDEWKQECAKLLVEALQTKGRARYGREHSGFTPEPPAERKKKKRGRARMIISDSDSGGARSGPAKGKSKGKSRASIQDSAQARKYQPHPKKRGLGSSSGSGGESFQGGARIAKKPPKKKAKTKAGSPGPSRDGTANSAMPLTKTALQPLPNLITKRQRADSESSEEVPLTTMVPATSEQLIQDRRDSARSQSAASSKSTPVPRVISLPREATGPAIPSSSPPPKIVKTSNEIQMRQSLDPPPSPPGTVPASTPSLPVAPLPPPAGQAATPTAVTHNTPAAPAIPIQPAVTLNQKVDKHRGSQIKLVPTRFHPVSSLTTKASIAGVLSPALSVTTANSTNVPAIDPQVSPTPEDAANTTTNPLSELVPLRPLPSLSILNDNSKDDYRVVDSPVTLSPTSSIETPLSASMKKFPSNRTRKSAMDVVDEASKSFGSASSIPALPLTPLAPIPEPKPAPKLQKKWEGELIVSDSVLCRVHVEPVVGPSSRLLPVLLRSLTALKMTQSYPAYGVHYFLTAAYESPSEFARVTADVQSTQCLQNLGSYMEHESKASFLVASESFGTSVFLMYSPKITIPFITLPPIVKATAVPLVIVLLIKKNSRPLPLEKIKSISRRSLPPIPRTDTLYSNPMYQIAARHFGVSKTFIDYIRGKDYCIYTAACSTEPSLWPAAPDWTADDPESRRLFKLLTLLDAKRKGWISLETDVVFIHADTWDSTETPMTSSLVTRAAQSETQFFRFGTSLAPLYGEQPHVKAVFPIGGILTFTPRAIFEKCEKVFQLIDQAANNTFWQVYVHAETIGLLNLLVHEPKAPPSCSHALVGILARLKSNSFDKTCLCITSSLPRPQSDVTTTQDLHEAWMYEQFKFRDLYEDEDSLVAACVSRLRQKYCKREKLDGWEPGRDGETDTKSEDMGMKIDTGSDENDDLVEMEGFVNQLVAMDLMDMRRQPYLYTSYRQYVMLVGGNPSSYGASGIKAVLSDAFTLPED